MENGKDSLKTYITGLKNSCSSGGPTEKLSNSSADRKIVEVRSQRYSKLYELHRKIKQSLQKNGYSFQCTFRVYTQMHYKLRT